MATTPPRVRWGNNAARNLHAVFELLEKKLLNNEEAKTQLFEGGFEDTEFVRIKEIIYHISTTKISTPNTDRGGLINSPEEEAQCALFSLQDSLNHLKRNADNLLKNSESTHKLTQDHFAILRALSGNISDFLLSQHMYVPTAPDTELVALTPRAREASRLPCLPPLDRLGVERARGR